MASEAAIDVLLVESNADDARRVADLLDKAPGGPFNARVAETLADAVGALETASFDVVLLSLTLPDSRGIFGLRQILETAQSSPVVVLSSTTNDALALEAVQSGAQDYLEKDRTDEQSLARAIRYAIERKSSEERLAYLANYDQVTGVANRSLFSDRLDQAVQRAIRNRSMLAVLFIDLDEFTGINDSFGHETGDQVLKAVAVRILAAVRKVDTVARFGGDEFTIILEGIAVPASAGLVAAKIIETVGKPFDIGQKTLTVTASVGAAVFDPHDGDPATLLRDADRAMYRAKSEGRNTFRLHADA
ncbi:MAG: diguanylate cyclase response regulator [Actinomycetota bacterium]|nr:diguanylate cyclase response regulator [Actinomycetota bacterium]